MFVDFEKAFDSIEWAFIERALNYFNFGPSLVNWFRLFYNQVSSVIQNNGWVSESFSLGRGVRQGCPMSPYLFTISEEKLANFIRRDKDVKGDSLNLHPLPPLISFFLLGDIIYTRANLQVRLPP